LTDVLLNAPTFSPAQPGGKLVVAVVWKQRSVPPAPL
jgi:hypothetical protein